MQNLHTPPLKKHNVRVRNSPIVWLTGGQQPRLGASHGNEDCQKRKKNRIRKAAWLETIFEC